MEITNRTVIKEYGGAQVNLVIDSNGNKFIEKIQFHNPPKIKVDFGYGYNILEIFESILKPLEIPHPQIVDSVKNEESTTIIMEYIDGINCEAEPKAEYLYLAAEKLGTIYNKSKMNMKRLDKCILEKYTLTKEKVLNQIKVIGEHFTLPPVDSIIDYICEKYPDPAIFVKHGDLQFKNFIYNGDLHLIDWDNVHISPFNDVSALIWHAGEIGANIDEIKKRYCQFAQISSINDEDMKLRSIISIIGEVFTFLIYDCSEWLEDSYNELQDLIKSFGLH